jgi:hypothetical protein
MFEAFPFARGIAFPANGCGIVCETFPLAVDNSPGFRTRFRNQAFGFSLGLLALGQEFPLVTCDCRQSGVLVISVVFHGSPISD